jgi:uncharacterized protein
MIAMLWVGGGILVHGLAEFGFAGPEHVIHAISEAVRPVPAIGEILAWIATASGSAIVGLIAGAITTIIVTIVKAPFRKSKAEH